MKTRRELEQDAAQFIVESLFAERIEFIDFGFAVDELFDMRYQFWRFYGIDKTIRAFRIPIFQDSQCRKLIKGSVYLKSVEMRAIKFKPFSRGNIFGIKDIFPFGVVEGGTTDMYIFSRHKNKNYVYEKEGGIVGRVHLRKKVSQNILIASYEDKNSKKN